MGVRVRVRVGGRGRVGKGSGAKAEVPNTEVGVPEKKSCEPIRGEFIGGIGREVTGQLALGFRETL